MDIGGSISWYQTKIANYDKQTWEKSIEQRILHGLESRPKKESTLNTNLLDVDLIRGTAFARAKPKHDWCAVLLRGCLRSAFPILYLDYWRRHLSPRLAAYLIFHFFIQLLQVSCFLVVDPLRTHVTEADVVVPLLMGLCLGILHSQITSAHGSHSSISTAGSSTATVGAADVALTSVTNAKAAVSSGVSAQGNTSGPAEAFLRGQSCLSNSYPGRRSDGIEAFNVPSPLSSKLKKWRCRTSEKSGHKYSVRIKDNQKSIATTTSSSSSHLQIESENPCDVDERANEADEDSCAEENKHYQSNRPSDGDNQPSQTLQQQQQAQPSSRTRSHFLHARNRKQELSGDALLRETPQIQSAVFSRRVSQPPSAGHDADVESDPYDMEAKLEDDVEKNGTPENGSLTGVINAADSIAPAAFPGPMTIKIVKKRGHALSTPQVIGSCLRKRSNSLSPGFCFSKFSAKTEAAPRTVLPLNGRPNEFSISPPPEDVLQHFKEAKFRGVPDPEVFAEYFEQSNLSPRKLNDLDHQKGLITKPSPYTKLVTKPNDACETLEGSKRSGEKLQQPPPKKTEFRSERSVRQRAVLPVVPKAFTKFEPNSQLIDAASAEYQTGRTTPQHIDRYTCSVNGRSNQMHDPDFEEVGTSELPSADFGKSITGVAPSDGPRADQTTSLRRHTVTSVGRTEDSPEAVGISDIDPSFQSHHTGYRHHSRENVGSAAVPGPSSACQVRQVGFAADHDLGTNEQGEEEEEEEDSEDALPTDTFTCRRRQRAKFLQLFWERAKRQRLSRVYSTDPAAPTGGEADQAAAPSPTFLSQSQKSSDIGDVCKADLEPQFRRFRSYSVSKSSQRADTAGPGRRKSASVTVSRMPVTSNRSAWASKHTVGLHVRNKLSPPCMTAFNAEDPLEAKHAQTASETEYDRMNSDIGSDIDSSSASAAEGDRPPPPSSQPQNSAFTGESSTMRGATAVSMCGGTFINSLKKQRMRSAPHLKVHSPSQVVYQRGAPEAAVDPKVSAAFAQSLTTAAAVSVKTSSDRDASSALNGKLDDDGGGQDPFLLWYLRAFHGITDQSSTGSLETVWCYIWENEKVKKVNLTLLDIGWSIIQAVERQPVSYFYPKLSCIATILLALLPLLFHSWYPHPMGEAATMNRSGGSLTVVEFQSQRLVTPAESTLDSPATLALAIYNWLSEFFANLPDIVTALKSTAILSLSSWSPDRIVIVLGIWLRFNIFGAIFFLLCVAERAFQQRLLYAKHFFSLTSGHRARKCRIPHFRLNKVAHVKCWLTLRSYLKKQGPQRSVESIITSAFYLTFTLGLFVCAQLLIGKPRRKNLFTNLVIWDILGCTSAVSIFLLRFLTLGTKITKKYRNLSVLITEQINVYLSMEKKPHKKEELSITNQVLRLAECLLKEVDGPYRICGWAVNPLVYNVFKLVLLSCFSALVSEFLGFKLKLYKLKLNPANW